MNQVTPNNSVQVISTPAQPQAVPTQAVVQTVPAAPQVVQEAVPTMDEAMQAVESVEYIDPNVVTLSTGFVVRFKQLPKAISDEFVTTIFRETELDDDNNIRVDSENRNEQVRLAGEFMKLNASIIGAGGVELISPLPPEEQWLEQLQFSPTITDKFSHIDWSNPSKRAKHFLFLRFYALADQDLHLLSEFCLNQGT